MTAASAVIEVTDATFEDAVIKASRQRPVVVDFWAPWCGPCRVLRPMIEQIASEYGGKVTVGKINTDENPQVAMKYQIQSIPAVKAFVDGEVASEFLGAVPEPQVREFFSKLLPSEAETIASDALEMAARGEGAAAAALFLESLSREPRNVEALVGLATLLVDRGEAEDAQQYINRAAPDRRAKALGHRIFLADFARRHEGEDLAGEAKANERDPRARYRWGVMLASRGEYIPGLEELLDSVRIDKLFADGAARKAILAIFDLLGPDSDITKEYQRTLSQILF